MKVSGFTFLRNAEQLGFPFVQSIQSALPIVDEFIVNVGASTDNTLQKVKAIQSPKIKILQSDWNEHVCDKGFVYAQQKMIAQYSCTGDWAFYLEGDELIHETEYPQIRNALTQHMADDRVEALVFDYLHFYGNIDTVAWSPAWYRRAPRVIKTSVRNFAPDGLFWLVLGKKNRRSRYPRAALANATIYHYGWARPQLQMQEKFSQVQRYWKRDVPTIDYRAIDPKTLHRYNKTHPAALADYLTSQGDLFVANPAHKLTRRERKNRIGLKLEAWFGLELSKKHYRLVR